MNFSITQVAAIVALLFCSYTTVFAEITVKVLTDKEDAMYTTSEKVQFTVSVFDGKKKLDWGKVSWSLSKDGYETLSRGEGLLEEGAGIRIDGKLETPGFLRLTATFTAPDKKRVTGYGGAAVSPLEIAPSMPVPDDFDTFWNEQKAKLAQVPLKAKEAWQPVKGTPGGVAVKAFDVEIDCGENEPPVSGYFAKPEKAEPRSLPALLWVHGAGVRSSILKSAVEGAENGFLSMDINAHGIPNGKPEKYYKDLSAGKLKDYRSMGVSSREQIYFRGMCLRLVRAIDYLTSHPEWDGKTVGVIGHSQGGYQALVAGGLDDRVTYIASGVPAGCDHTGMMADRVSGWPKLVPLLEGGKPAPAALEASRYIDGVNFATRCKARAVLSVGFIDRTCPPTSVYAAYNVLEGEKEMINEPLMGHYAAPSIRARFMEALMEHAGLSVAR